MLFRSLPYFETQNILASLVLPCPRHGINYFPQKLRFPLVGNDIWETGLKGILIGSGISLFLGPVYGQSEEIHQNKVMSSS